MARSSFVYRVSTQFGELARGMSRCLFVVTVQLSGSGMEVAVMAVRTDRVEARVSPDERERIERAAAFSGESMSAFMVAAAVERADEVIAERSATVVPADYFDQLVAALDEPAEKAPRLAAAAKKARRQRRIRTA